MLHVINTWLPLPSVAVWETLIENLPEYVFWKDIESRYVGCNANFAQLVGLASPKDIVGKTDFDLPWQVQGDSPHFFRQGDQATLQRLPVVQQEETLALPGREPLLVSVTKMPILDAQGHTLGILGMAIDITAQKKAEQALKNAEAQADLAQQTKAAFLANMRHDLRTPFSAIVGLLHTVERQLTDTHLKALIETAIEGAEQFLNRINQIIAFSAGEEGFPSVVCESFSPKSVIQALQTLLQPLAQQQGSALHIEGLEDLPKQVRGDATRCREILLSLLSNALQVTAQGTVTLRASAVSNGLELVVEDTGPGIPSEQLATLFEPFVRLKPAYQQSTAGTGLGLALVKQHLDALGGSVTVHSTLGQGSTFCCFFPCEPSTVRGLHRHVLLVEDNPSAALAVKVLFESFGCSLDLATTAAEARAKVQTGFYGLILMDLGLPDGSGLEVAQSLRCLNDPERAATPIVALSAHLDARLRQQCLESGLQATFTKPLTLKQAEDLIETYLPPEEKTA